MKLFIDSGSVAEVEEIAAWGVLAGATTNPSLLAKESGEPEEIIRKIASLVNGPTSAEVVSSDADGMVREGEALAALDPHVVVKVPFSAAGLQATSRLAERGHKINMTLVFSAPQAILAAEAGATYISAFMGRLDDVGINSLESLREIVDATAANSTGAQVLAASIRNPIHVTQAAEVGADVATIPGKVLKQMLVHPLTESGIAQFDKDWASRPEFAEWLKKLVDSHS